MSAQSILIVDDEPDIRAILEDILTDEGYQVYTSSNAQQAKDYYRNYRLDAVLLDIWMPEIDGISLLKEWSEETLRAPVIMISGHGTVDTAVEAVRFGAYDFLEKPLSTARLLVTIKRALQSHQLENENKRLQNQLQPCTELIGKSELIGRLRDQIEQAAQSNSRVLIAGEAGSGKGVVVRQLHSRSARAQGPLVDIRLGAIPAHSLESQLFGTEQQNLVQEGRFEQARQGTLFLDEISDIPLETQTRLLNTLEAGSFIRVGGKEPIAINARIVCATNTDLSMAVAQGKFREDLYYRLNVIPIHVPPLREHKEDIPELTSYWVDRMVEQEKLAYRIFPTSALNIMRDYDWPGNVRELKNLIQRLLILNRGEEVSREEVELALGTNPESIQNTIPEQLFEGTLRDARDRFERYYINYHLQGYPGNMTEFAKSLGMERTHLYRKLKSLGIDPKTRKPES